MRVPFVLASLATGVLLIPAPTADASCIPGFDYAAFGKDSLRMGGGGSTDSFNSALADYATAHNSTSGGNIGTNGTTTPSAVLLGASTEIGGNIQYGVGCSASCLSAGSATVDGTTSALGSAVTMPSVSVPIVAPSLGPLNVTGAVTISAATYDHVDVGNGNILTMNAGTYVFDTLTVKGEIRVTGAVTVYLKCALGTTAIDINAGGLINAVVPQKPTNFMMFAGSSCATADLRGGANTSFGLYAPDTAINLNGGTEIYGSVVGKSIDNTGGVAIHFDQALSSFAGGGFSCSPIEVSRATPVVALLNGNDHVVQGTFEAPTGAPTTITTAASIAAFTFPYLKGHMRARLASSLNVVADNFASGSILFDAGASGKIPTVTTAGCTATNGSCRRIFTSTTVPGATGRLFHPALVTLDDTTAPTLGPLITAGAVGPFVAADYTNIVHKVLNGGLGGVDRSTVAVIQSSSVAGSGSRPTMAYFGATDGMIHAVCATTGGTTATQPTSVCPALGTELWAFIPRVQLPAIAANTAKIDGSVRVLDVFGDFTSDPAIGAKSFHTVLIFQTGYKINALASASYAIDITDPATPVLLWEYQTPTSPASVDLGTGLAVGAGAIISAGVRANLAVLETNNGGSGGAAVVANGVSIETGAKVWTTPFSYVYSTDTSPGRYLAADESTLASGIPGGAVGVDLLGNSFISDIVMGDIYGELWRLDATTGTSRNGAGIPSFKFTATKHPIGALPAIFSNGSKQYAAFASGGYDDPIAAGWAAASQNIIVAKLDGTGAPTTEATAGTLAGPLLVNKTFDTAGEKTSTQALVVGNQLFVTTDSLDVNSSTYATSSSPLSSGHSYAVDLSGSGSTFSSTTGTGTVIFSGAGGLANSGTTMIASAGNEQARLGAAATSTVGASVDTFGKNKTSRQLWLKTNQ